MLEAWASAALIPPLTCKTDSLLIGSSVWSTFHPIQILQPLKMSLTFPKIINDTPIPREYVPNSLSSCCHSLRQRTFLTSQHISEHILPPSLSSEGYSLSQHYFANVFCHVAAAIEIPMNSQLITFSMPLRTHCLVLTYSIVSFQTRLYFP